MPRSRVRLEFSRGRMIEMRYSDIPSPCQASIRYNTVSGESVEVGLCQGKRLDADGRHGRQKNACVAFMRLNTVGFTFTAVNHLMLCAQARTAKWPLDTLAMASISLSSLQGHGLS